MMTNDNFLFSGPANFRVSFRLKRTPTPPSSTKLTEFRSIKLRTPPSDHFHRHLVCLLATRKNHLGIFHGLVYTAVFHKQTKNSLVFSSSVGRKSRSRPKKIMVPHLLLQIVIVTGGFFGIVVGNPARRSNEDDPGAPLILNKNHDEESPGPVGSLGSVSFLKHGDLLTAKFPSYGPNFDLYVNHGDAVKNQQVPAEKASDWPLEKFAVGSDDRVLACVHNYTGNGPAREINRAIRADDGDGLRKWGLLTKETRDAFETNRLLRGDYILKPYQGTVKRGIYIDHSKLGAYQVGQTVTWPAFSSTSANGNEWRGNVKFTIHISKMLDHAQATPTTFLPADIRSVSKYWGEGEVLIPPYTEFRVLSVWIPSWYNFFSDTADITLETTEFPSVPELLEQQRWSDVQKYFEVVHSDHDVGSREMAFGGEKSPVEGAGVPASTQHGGGLLLVAAPPQQVEKVHRAPTSSTISTDSQSNRAACRRADFSSARSHFCASLLESTARAIVEATEEEVQGGLKLFKYLRNNCSVTTTTKESQKGLDILLQAGIQDVEP